MAPGASSQAYSLGFVGNTSLEQISDWLTKILVGVGLTQIGQVPTIYGQIATFFGPAIGGDIGGTVAVCLTIFFPIVGFMIGYLWTRLYLGEELVLADTGRGEVTVEETKILQAAE